MGDLLLIGIVGFLIGFYLGMTMLGILMLAKDVAHRPGPPDNNRYE